MSKLLNEFNEYRQRMNEVVLRKNILVIKRLCNLDTNTYEKEILIKNKRNIWACSQYGVAM